MDTKQVDRSAHAYYRLAGELADEVYAGTYRARDFDRRIKRVGAYIDEFYASGDERLQEAAALMISILVALPRLDDAKIREQIAAAGDEWSRIINEVITDGVRIKGETFISR